ncbi:MAG: response regulator transcription factor [Coriobacteriia bacterium]|nr:response regulator transcription factor [Coriobacteriia bacterium]
MRLPQKLQASQRSILLVEDDEMIASGLVWTLEQEGYLVKHCASVADAVEHLNDNSYDLALLDVQLPDGTGFDVQQALQGTKTATIFLTAIDDKVMTVRALEQGAIDYLTKPFDLRELHARIKKAFTLTTTSAIGQSNPLLTSSQQQALLGTFKLNDLEVDTVSGRVHLKSEALKLTALEYRLLIFLLANRGVLLSRGNIIDNVWEESGGYVEDNTLTIYINALRKKLGDELEIETVRGVGYRVND